MHFTNMSLDNVYVNKVHFISEFVLVTSHIVNCIRNLAMKNCFLSSSNFRLLETFERVFLPVVLMIKRCQNISRAYIYIYIQGDWHFLEQTLS